MISYFGFNIDRKSTFENMKNIARQDLIAGEYELENTEDANMQQEFKTRLGVRNLFTELLGGILQQQKCWERSVCKIGSEMAGFKANDMIFL